MKRATASLWILVSLWVIAALGIGLSYWVSDAQTEGARHLVAQIREVEEDIKQGEWPAAWDTLAHTRRMWESTRRRWALHVDHTEMDVVTDALVEAQALVTNRDDSALAALHRARDRIITLPERDRLSLENLF